MLEHWDAIVTDPRLRLADVERALDSSTGDELYLGDYRTMASGGMNPAAAALRHGTEDSHEVLGGVLRWTGSYTWAWRRACRAGSSRRVVAGSPQRPRA